MKMMKLRKAHCSPPLVGKDNSMASTSHLVQFPATVTRGWKWHLVRDKKPIHFLHTSDGKQILMDAWQYIYPYISCGGLFWSSFHGHSHNSLKSRLHFFFRFLTSGLEQCVELDSVLSLFKCELIASLHCKLGHIFKARQPWHCCWLSAQILHFD